MPTISRRTIYSLLSWLPVDPVNRVTEDALAELRRAIDPRPRRPRPEKVAKRAAKNEETAEIRQEAMHRANGFCECGCGRFLGAGSEMDHFTGRARVKQSLESVWMLTRLCHRLKTENKPHAYCWVDKWIAHCRRYNYVDELARAETRLAVLTQKGFGA